MSRFQTLWIDWWDWAVPAVVLLNRWQIVNIMSHRVIIHEPRLSDRCLCDIYGDLSANPSFRYVSVLVFGLKLLNSTSNFKLKSVLSCPASATNKSPRQCQTVSYLQMVELI